MKRFKNILYISENAADQQAALARAVTLAQSNQARLTCVDMVPSDLSRLGIQPDTDLWREAHEMVLSQSQSSLETLIQPYRDSTDIHAEVIPGDTHFLEVIRAVLRHDYDLVIKAAEEPEWLDRLFGSDDMHLLRKCPCPVWLTKQHEKPSYENVMAAIDFDLYERNPAEESLNQMILDLASSLAIADGARLHIVHAFEADEVGFMQVFSERPDLLERDFRVQLYAKHRQYLDGLTWRLKQNIGDEGYEYIDPRIHLLEGPANKVIPGAAEKHSADIVIMGTVARTGVPGLLIGNTAEAILDQLKCSLIAVKPDGFITPVTLVS